MFRRGMLVLTFVTALAAAPAQASVLFYENFNDENGGTPALNFNAFDQFVVSDGTVDLIGSGPGGTSFDFVPGNGLYVDLDGSTSNSGLMLGDPLSIGPGEHLLSYRLAGSHRGSTEFVRVSLLMNGVPFMNQVHDRDSQEPFSTSRFRFNASVPFDLQFSFEGLSADNVGLLLDEVRLEAIPEPTSMLLLGTGFVAAAMRRRRTR